MAASQQTPLTRYLRVQLSTEREIRRMLKSAYVRLEHQINVLANLDRKTVSQRVRLVQAREAKDAIKRELSRTMDQVGGEIRGQRRVAASAAGETVAESAAIFSAAGLSPSQVTALQRSLVLAAETNVQAAMKRLMGRSYVPLADSVYKTKQLVGGQISKIIQDHLARGSSARDLARDVRTFVNPNVRGGVKYASMRLARSELNNAFHAVQVDQAKQCPFVERVRWNLSGSHPRPDACNDYEDHGTYLPDDVPDKPHPQCLCYVTYETPSRDQFIDDFRAGKYDQWLDDQGL